MPFSSDYSSDCVSLLIFCKRPKLKQGKQRLAATLGDQAAFEVAQCLLACALEDARSWPGPVVLSPASREDIEWAASLLPERPDTLIVAQPNGNLGERINAVDAELRGLGLNRILTIGTDAPILGETFFTQACSGLEHADIVLSAAEDGGVTVMAASAPWPDLKALPWSTDQLGQALYQRCKVSALNVEFIASSYDIDIEADLQKLLVDLENDHRPARQALLDVVRAIVKNQRRLERAGAE